MLCLFELRNPSKSWDAVCLVSTLKMQTEISNASGPLTAQTYSAFVLAPPWDPHRRLFCTSCYRSTTAAKHVQKLSIKNKVYTGVKEQLRINRPKVSGRIFNKAVL